MKEKYDCKWSCRDPVVSGMERMSQCLPPSPPTLFIRVSIVGFQGGKSFPRIHLVGPNKKKCEGLTPFRPPMGADLLPFRPPIGGDLGEVTPFCISAGKLGELIPFRPPIGGDLGEFTPFCHRRGKLGELIP